MAKFNFLNDEEIKKNSKFYRSIGFPTKEAVVLSAFVYDKDEDRIERIMDLYDNSKGFVDFCYEVLTERPEELTKAITIDENDKYDSGTIPSTVGIKACYAKKICFSSLEEDSEECDEADTDNDLEMGVRPGVKCMAPSRPKGRTPQFLRKISSIDDLPSLGLPMDDSYAEIEPSKFQKVINSPTSTFKATYNISALTNTIAQIRKGNIEVSKIKTEEIINGLEYNLKKTEDMFSVTSEVTKINDDDVIFFGIQGKEIMPSKQNVVFLLDVSGSMTGREVATQAIIFTCIKKMNPGDVVSLVTYSDNDKIVLNSHVYDGTIDRILYEFLKVKIRGWTCGSKGIENAYRLIESNYDKDAVNRIMLITDGDFNFGTCNISDLKEIISEKRKTGAYLTVVGTGIYNLRDDKLDMLSKNGNGNYCIINTVEDAYNVLYKRYASIMYPIAKNVKVQVEFNPNLISEYQLVGYENRMLSHDDFKNDDVVADPFGSGSYAVALYRIKYNNTVVKSNLKYQSVEADNTTELATITVRYQDIQSEEYNMISAEVSNEMIADASNAKKAYEAYLCAEELRQKNTSRFIELFSDYVF